MTDSYLHGVEVIEVASLAPPPAAEDADPGTTIAGFLDFTDPNAAVFVAILQELQQ